MLSAGMLSSSNMASASLIQPNPSCAVLVSAGLGSQVLLPGSEAYQTRQDSYWSNSAKLSPSCIVLPRDAQEVSVALSALVSVGKPFAIRSGGHTNWPGANNINGGVTVDLGLLNAVTYDAATETANIGPGARWRDVYGELIKYKRAVAGGREGNVGVAGLILGGGNTFFTARQGFACDNVVAYEVVLADGSIVVADENNHADLFRALKGGSNNFGIVTKFTMKAIESDRVWGGMAFLPKDVIPQATDALVHFTDNLERDVNNNLVVIFTHMPDFKDVVIGTLYANMIGEEKPAAFDEWLALPEMMNTYKNTTIAEMAFEYNIPANHYNSWFTLTFRNDARIVAYASKLHDKLVEDLKLIDPTQSFTTQCLFQPLPALFGRNSVAAGGNVMGVERQEENGLLWLAVAMMQTAEQEAQAYHLVRNWTESVRAFAESLPEGSGIFPWRYLNYADHSQAVLESYGAENVQKIRDAAAAYDPTGVFQTLVPGGFKISQVAA